MLKNVIIFHIGGPKKISSIFGMGYKYEYKNILNLIYLVLTDI